MRTKQTLGLFVCGWFASQPVARADLARNYCVEPSAAERVNECPSALPQAAQRLSRRRPRKSNFRVAEKKKKAKPSGPTGPSIELDTASRRNRKETQARAFELLQQEVRVLGRLVRNTRKDDPERPRVLLRLAETYFEMQQAVNARKHSLDQPIFEARQAKNAKRVRALTAQQKRYDQELKEARERAVGAYTSLVSEHPDFRNMDEVLFSLAFTLEELKRVEDARKVYHRMITRFPDSRFVPYAWLSFAEYYFAQGEMAPANQFYEKVREFPPDRNPLYGYALYKQAWAAYNLQQFHDSLEKFVAVIRFAREYPDARDVKNLARQSRKELVFPYAQFGQPNVALEFFGRYAENREQALEMLESLADLYFDTGEWSKAIATYHRLMAESPNSPRLCLWQAQVTNAVVSSRAKPEQVRELTRLIDVYETVAGGQAPPEIVSQCKQEAATLLVWLATAWHKEVVGEGDEQPGTKNQTTMAQASALYKLLIDKFPDMEDMEFPTINREDWPTQYKVAFYYAELLYSMEQWAQCGPAYDQVVTINPRGPYTSDAALAAVLCYNKFYEEQYGETERLTKSDEPSRGRRRGRGRKVPEKETSFEPREFTELEKGMLGAFQRYVCFVDNSEELPTIKYRRARIYYQANRFDEAATLFRDIAWNHRDEPMAPYAANLYLDSLVTLGQDLSEPRPQCLSDGRQAVEPLAGWYCGTDDKRADNDHLCGRLDKLQCGFLRKEAEALQSAEQYKAAARQYVRIFREFFAKPESCAGEKSDSVGMDEVLYNAAINYEAAKLLGNAIKVRGVLIKQFPESPWAKRAIYLIGANWHAIAVYDRAAEYYEDFAQKFPGEDGKGCSEEEKAEGLCPIAHEALMTAVLFRLGLGQYDTALRDARLFEKNYKRKLPRQSAQVMYSVGTAYKKQEDWDRVTSYYRTFLKNYQRTAYPHHLVLANLEIAKAYAKKNEPRLAGKYYQEAVKQWSRGVPRAIQALEEDASKKGRYLLEAVNAAAEALFELAEYKYAEFRAIRFPKYTGGRSIERVNRWAKTVFVEWINEKMRALKAAEQEYGKIADLKITIDGVEIKSPPWMIAAASRIGQMYRRFVDDFRDAPIPDKIANDPELRDIYEGALDEKSEPLVRQAVDKFKFCIDTSTAVRWFSEYSRECEQELNRLNPREYPLAAELRGGADFLDHTVAEPGVADLSRDAEDDLGAAAAEGGS